jgi:hypothetical protein
VESLLFGHLAVRSAPKNVCFLLLGLALSSFASAQDQNGSPTSQNELWKLPPTDRAAAPDVYLLPDASGKLRQVLGFRYEDFLRAWNLRDAAAGGPPCFAIQELSAAGTSAEDRIRLRIELRIVAHVDGWLGVPLKLPDLIVERVEFDKQAPGECLVYDAERGGHVAWIEGHPGQERNLAITGSAKPSESAGKSSLELALPHAALSQLTLTVPETDVEFKSSPGTEISTKTDDGQTEVQLRGNAIPLRVEWSRRQESATAQTTTLESEGEMTVTVSRRRALYQARLRLNSFGNPLELVRVRLPQGVNLTHVQTPPELQAVVTEAQDAEGSVMEVRSKSPSGETWVLEILAEQPLQDNDVASRCRVGGFEVLGAVRQSGQLTLEVDENLQAYFDLSGDLEQVPLVGAEEPTKSRTALAAFSYARFPWALTVHTLPKQRRVNVAPGYHLQLTPDEARLEMAFDYQFAGARTFAVRVDLRGWQLTDDPLESGGAVEASRVVETEQGLLVLPLVNPDVQRARIALVVRKPLQLGEQTFELPEAAGGFVLPGQLVVEADPSLQVTIDVSRLEGLGALAATDEAPAGDDSPLVFRTFLSRASLGATITRRQRQVAVDAHTAVEVSERQLTVSERLDYLVKYRPLTQLELWAPQELPEQRSFQVLIDGRELEATTSVESSTEGLSTPRKLIVSLPRPVQDAFQLDLTYSIRYAGATPESPAHVSLPLMIPVDPLISHEVAVQARQPWRIALGQTAQAEAWTLLPTETSPATATSTWRLRSVGPESSLPLVVQKDSLEDLQNAILERAWLQSWVAGDSQQDRAVFQFRSPHANVLVELPPAATNRPLEVLLDGEPVDFESPTEGRLAVSLPHVSPRERHVLELRYQRPINLFSGTRLTTALPKLVCRPMSAPVYWQLVLPRGWQVVRLPAGLTSESWLGWKAYRWGRQPTRSQSDLEQWTNASSAPPPSPTTSQYVYSSFDVPVEVSVIVARQMWLILAATLAAFGLGMLCVYTPIAGKFAFWLGLALALLALVFVYPELTLLAGQAMLWGGVMTLAVLVLRQAFLGRAAVEVVLAPASSQVGSTSATESLVQQRLTSRADDEPTVAARVDESKY